MIDLKDALCRSRMVEARKKGTHSLPQWLALKFEFESRCVKCGNAGYVEKDHIVPIFAGGSDAIENIQPFCASCNCGKGGDSFNWKEHRRREGFADVNNCLRSIAKRTLSDNGIVAERQLSDNASDSPATAQRYRSSCRSSVAGVSHPYIYRSADISIVVPLSVEGRCKWYYFFHRVALGRYEVALPSLMKYSFSLELIGYSAVSCEVVRSRALSYRRAGCKAAILLERLVARDLTEMISNLRRSTASRRPPKAT